MSLPHQILKREPWGMPVYWTVSSLGWFGYTATTVVLGVFLLAVFTLIYLLLAPDVVPLLRNFPLLRLYTDPLKWVANQIAQVVAIAFGLTTVDPLTKRRNRVSVARLPLELIFSGLFKIFPNPRTFYFSIPTVGAAFYGAFVVYTNPDFFAPPQVPAPGEAISQSELRELEKNQNLQPGIYKSDAGTLMIHQQGKSFCVQLQNEYGTAINSVLPEQPKKGFYLVHGFELVSLIQQGKNTLIWFDETEGITEYTLARGNAASSADMSTPISDCLGSTGPFAFYADMATEAGSTTTDPAQIGDFLPLQPGIYVGQTTESYILIQRGSRYCMSYAPDEISPVNVFSLSSEPDEDGFYKADYGNGVFFTQVDNKTLRYADRAMTADAYRVEGYSGEEAIEGDTFMQECLASSEPYAN